LILSHAGVDCEIIVKLCKYPYFQSIELEGSRSKMKC